MTTFDEIKIAKVRTISTAARGDDGKVIRTATNLSGNAPFRVKLYAMVNDPPEIAVRAAPNQVQLIVKHMLANREPATGGQIVQAMIDAGFKTKIDPPVLFAYYRKLLERLGVQHVN